MHTFEMIIFGDGQFTLSFRQLIFILKQDSFAFVKRFKNMLSHFAFLQISAMAQTISKTMLLNAINLSPNLVDPIDS